MITCVATVSTRLRPFGWRKRRRVPKSVLEAGVSAYYDFDPETDSASDIVEAVYLAMRKAHKARNG